MKVLIADNQSARRVGGFAWPRCGDLVQLPGAMTRARLAGQGT